MSGCAQIDAVGVGDERLGSKRRGEGGTQAIGTELMQWEQDMGSSAWEDMVEVGHERSGSKRHEGRRQASAGWAWIDMVGVGHKQSGSNWHG